MAPVAIAPVLAFGRRGRTRWIAFQPLPHLIMVKLLAPQQPGQGLPHHQPGVVRERSGNDGSVKFIRLVHALPEEFDEGAAKRRACGWRITQAQQDRATLTRAQRQVVVGRGFGAYLRGIHRRLVAVYEIVVDSVLHEGRCVGYAIEAPAIRVVLREQEGWRLSAVKPAPPERCMLRLNHTVVTP